MREMVGGCCVCSDERGWPDNPLVYCDGTGCNVAVHQACYGIVTVPTGPWYCRKCESSDKNAKIRCEICPSRSGAFKRVDSGGWAHVVCALYIPEVRFGNVTTMEPIILQFIPPERYSKSCYICQEMNKINKASMGACMQCNKSGCKQQFHVTCAQSLGLLCEEAGNFLDNVKYCGYCQHHYSKLQRKGGGVKTIPPYKPVSQDGHSSDSSPEKEGEPNAAKNSGSVITVSSASSTSGAPKTVPTGKSSAGRKSSSQQASSSVPKSSFAPQRISSAPTSTITSSSSTSSSVSSNSKSASSDVEPSTSKISGSVPVKMNQSDGTSLTPKPASDSDGSGSSHSHRHKKNFMLVPKNKASKSSTGKSSSSAKSPITISDSESSYPMVVGSSVPSNSDIQETIIKVNIEKMSPVGGDIKQTKKKKAIVQSTAQDLTLQVPELNMPTPSSAAVKERPPSRADRPPEPSERPIEIIEDKPRKVKNDIPAKVFNVPMDTVSAPSPYFMSASSTSSLPMNQPYPVERSPMGHSLSPSVLLHNQNMTIKYSQEPLPLVSEIVQPETLAPSMSSPHSQSSQGLNLSANQTVGSSDYISSTMMSAPSTRDWGFKVAYEPQPSQSIPTKMPTENDMLYPVMKRPRMEPVDVSSKNIKQPMIIIDDKISTGMRSSKKRATVTTPPVMPQHNSNLVMQPGILPQMLPSKRMTHGTPPPSTSQTYQEAHSPPASPVIGNDNVRKSNAHQRRAPHMLGNELNPDSAAAARLSEHLSAELAAHSVFRAPSPLVPPPLINRATSGGRLGTLGTNNSISLTSGGAQSLDQLLERQWEQGSQFLMEQAQHFDIASLLSCLHQLRSENVNLEEHVVALTERRDHLLAVNARLAIPLNSVPTQGSAEANKLSREAATSMISWNPLNLSALWKNTQNHPPPASYSSTESRYRRF